MILIRDYPSVSYINDAFTCFGAIYLLEEPLRPTQYKIWNCRKFSDYSVGLIVFYSRKNAKRYLINKFCKEKYNEK